MPLLFIISAPSGSGKSTLVHELFQRVSGLRFSISYTTRQPRGSEADGREYHFVARPRFEAMLAAGEFLEFAEVFGNYYGTAWAALEEAMSGGRDLVLDIDVQGARQVRRRFADTVGILIAPPNRETLEYRLRHRGLDSDEVVEKRLREAQSELAAYNDYDYVVINECIPTSVDRLCAIVEWERLRRLRGEAAAGSSPERILAESCRRGSVAGQLHSVLASFGVALGQEAQAAKESENRHGTVRQH